MITFTEDEMVHLDPLSFCWVSLKAVRDRPTCPGP
jgi:hypothetical protein